MKAKRMALAGAAGLAALVVVAGVSWACTSFSTISLSAPVAAAGEEVVVTGAGAKADAPVVVRWNSRSGAKLAETMVDGDGSFSVPVRIPEGQAGLHVVVAVDGDGDLARAAFEMVPSAVGAGSSAPATFGAGSATAAPGDNLVLGVGALAVGLVIAAGGTFAAVTGRRRVAALS